MSISGCQVNGLDRSWQRPPGVAAKLIDCKNANGNMNIVLCMTSITVVAVSFLSRLFVEWVG